MPPSQNITMQICGIVLTAEVSPFCFEPLFSDDAPVTTKLLKRLLMSLLDLRKMLCGMVVLERPLLFPTCIVPRPFCSRDVVPTDFRCLGLLTFILFFSCVFEAQDVTSLHFWKWSRGHAVVKPSVDLLDLRHLLTPPPHRMQFSLWLLPHLRNFHNQCGYRAKLVSLLFVHQHHCGFFTGSVLVRRHSSPAWSSFGVQWLISTYPVLSPSVVEERWVFFFPAANVSVRSCWDKLWAASHSELSGLISYGGMLFFAASGWRVAPCRG